MISGQPSTICAAFSDETVESVSVGFKESEYISNHKIQKGKLLRLCILHT